MKYILIFIFLNFYAYGKELKDQEDKKMNGKVEKQTQAVGKTKKKPIQQAAKKTVKEKVSVEKNLKEKSSAKVEIQTEKKTKFITEEKMQTIKKVKDTPKKETGKSKKVKASAKKKLKKKTKISKKKFQKVGKAGKKSEERKPSSNTVLCTSTFENKDKYKKSKLIFATTCPEGVSVCLSYSEIIRSECDGNNLIHYSCDSPFGGSYSPKPPIPCEKGCDSGRCI